MSNKEFKIRNLAIFASGEGSNAKSIIEHKINKSYVRYQVRVIITDKENAGVIKYAKEYNIPHFIVNDDHSNIIGLLKGLKIEVIALCGYLKLIPDSIVDNYYCLNIHPSLLPNYGGKGMYGIKVHEEVLKNGEKSSGFTIHRVTSKYDEGDIIYSVEVVIYKGETPISLRDRIKTLENKYYPFVLDETCRTLDILNPIVNIP